MGGACECGGAGCRPIGEGVVKFLQTGSCEVSRADLRVVLLGESLWSTTWRLDAMNI